MLKLKTKKRSIVSILNQRTKAVMQHINKKH